MCAVIQCLHCIFIINNVFLAKFLFRKCAWLRLARYAMPMSHESLMDTFTPINTLSPWSLTKLISFVVTCIQAACCQENMNLYVQRARCLHPNMYRQCFKSQATDKLTKLTPRHSQHVVIKTSKANEWLYPKIIWNDISQQLGKERNSTKSHILRSWCLLQNN